MDEMAGYVRLANAICKAQAQETFAKWKEMYSYKAQLAEEPSDKARELYSYTKHQYETCWAWFNEEWGQTLLDASLNHGGALMLVCKEALLELVNVYRITDKPGYEPNRKTERRREMAESFFRQKRIKEMGFKKSPAELYREAHYYVSGKGKYSRTKKGAKDEECI